MKPSLSSFGLSSSPDRVESDDDPVVECSERWPSIDKSTERLPLLRSCSIVTVWPLLEGLSVNGVVGKTGEAEEFEVWGGSFGDEDGGVTRGSDVFIPTCL